MRAEAQETDQDELTAQENEHPVAVDNGDPANANVDLQIVDDSDSFLPSLEEAFDKKRSAELIKAAQTFHDGLEYELQLAQKKEALLPEVSRILEMGPQASTLDLPQPQEFDTQIREIIRAYESPNPYQEVSKLVAGEPYKSLAETQHDFETFPHLKVVMTTSDRVKAVFRKHVRETHERRVESANERARKLAINMLQNLFFKITEIQEHLGEELRDQRQKVKYEGLEGFYECDDSSIGEALNRLKIAVERYKQLMAQADHIGELISVIGKYKDACAGELKWYPSRAISEYHNLRAIIDEHTPPALYKKAVWNRVSKSYDRLGGRYVVHNHNATRELSRIVTKINLLVDRIRQLIGPDVAKNIQQLPNDFGREGKDIYRGRGFLTHTGPTRRMYDILEQGKLESYNIQRERNPSATRTHPGGTENDTEIHSICFKKSKIYSSFSFQSSKIILIFSKTQILSEERPYVEMDGLHIFDRNYRGENPNSPGLQIDLTTTPNIIVVAREEKDKFLTFLAEKSAWKEMLSGMSREEFENWLEQNVIFADSLEEAEPKIHKIFDKRIHRKKGYVIPNGEALPMKGGKPQTWKFIPRT
ncbi:MAG: hypothetical protein WC285_00430 [Candidatus Gracilibacteria bacterium]|jgi:hypothetical protein